MPNTPVRAAAEGMPAINRRKALAVTGSGLAAALACMARPARAAVTDSPIMATFRQWDALYDQTYRKPAEDEDHMSQLCESMWALESKVKAMPATTAHDLIAKFVMISTYGSYLLESDSDVLFVEARAVLS